MYIFHSTPMKICNKKEKHAYKSGFTLDVEGKWTSYQANNHIKVYKPTITVLNIQEVTYRQSFRVKNDLQTIQITHHITN